ncbi:hypothetical protein A2U01_0017744, partial [Trifolium medium]|nr:hypothetical protein [Trifolium medium]
MTLGSSSCVWEMLVTVFVIREEVLAYEVPLTRRDSRFVRKEFVIFPRGGGFVPVTALSCSKDVWSVGGVIIDVVLRGDVWSVGSTRPLAFPEVFSFVLAAVATPILVDS